MSESLITFLKQGISKTGMPWWISSSTPFELERCPGCGFPYGIKVMNPSPEVKKVRFCFDEGDQPVEFDLSNLPVLPQKCKLCGWEQSIQEQTT